MFLTHLRRLRSQDKEPHLNLEREVHSGHNDQHQPPQNKFLRQSNVTLYYDVDLAICLILLLALLCICPSQGQFFLC